VTDASYHPWLHRFAVLLAVATLALVGLGGLVTSHGVGMAVPDWPNTYGYNMFFFPVSHWIGGIFYEHTHRLLASAVGLLTSVLALWLYGRNARPFLRWTGVLLTMLAVAACLAAPGRWADSLVLLGTGLAGLGASFIWPRREPSQAWLRRLGLVAFLGVVLQGVLGGLRVVLFKDQIGIFHATLAQLFFVLTCALALFTSKWWQQESSKAETPRTSELRNLQSDEHTVLPSDFGFRSSRLVVVTTFLILCQLILGATMRHQHAGLAIPDFPLAYGKLWPALDATSIAHYNQQRLEATSFNSITAAQVVLQMIHRMTALAIFVAVAGCAWTTCRRLGRTNPLSKMALGWVVLLVSQGLLGAATIWSNKAADIATLHVVVGALSLALGAMMSLTAPRLSVLVREARQQISPLTPLKCEPVTAVNFR
jgi:cytochrome c oxidase assembly protein subunit 15